MVLDSTDEITGHWAPWSKRDRHVLETRKYSMIAYMSVCFGAESRACNVKSESKFNKLVNATIFLINRKKKVQLVHCDAQFCVSFFMYIDGYDSWIADNVPKDVSTLLLYFICHF